MRNLETMIAEAKDRLGGKVKEVMRLIDEHSGGHCGICYADTPNGACAKFVLTVGERLAEEYNAARREFRLLVTAERLIRENIPARFVDASLETFVVSDSSRRPYEITRAYIERFTRGDIGGRGIVYQGYPGTGKTHLAVSIFRAAVLAGRTAYFGSMYDLLARVKRSYDGGDDDAVIADIACVDLLIVDDLGQERLTDWSRELTFAIFSRRYNDERPIIVTTNLTATDIAKRYGDSFFSRLVGISDVVSMRGIPDHRIVTKMGA